MARPWGASIPALLPSEIRATVSQSFAALTQPLLTRRCHAPAGFLQLKCAQVLTETSKNSIAGMHCFSDPQESGSQQPLASI